MSTTTADTGYVLMAVNGDEDWAPCATFLGKESADRQCEILNRRLHGDNMPGNKLDRFFRIVPVPFSPSIQDTGTAQLHYIRDWRRDGDDEDDEREYLTIPEALFDYETVYLDSANDLYGIATAPERDDPDYILLGGDDDDDGNGDSEAPEGALHDWSNR